MPLTSTSKHCGRGRRIQSLSGCACSGQARTEALNSKHSECQQLCAEHLDTLSGTTHKDLVHAHVRGGSLVLEATNAVAPRDGRSACSTTGLNYLRSQHALSRGPLPSWAGRCSTLRPTNDVSTPCTDSQEFLHSYSRETTMINHLGDQEPHA